MRIGVLLVALNVFALPLFVYGWEMDAADLGQLVADAHSGNPEAQYTLAHLLLKGSGMDADVRRALVWFARAAENGQRDACFELAIIYLEGNYVPKDSGKALTWLTRAAVAGHVEAQYMLGMAWRSRTPETAVEWLGKASLAGHDGARKALAELCRKTPVSGCE